MKRSAIRRTAFMPRPTKPIVRKTRIERHVKVRRVNHKRHSKNWIRAYGSPERCDWVSAQPCVGCGVGGDGEFRCENAHVATGQDAGGTSRKADARFIVPLCHECHIEDLHVNGRETFERVHNVNLLAEAARIDREYCAYAAAMGMAS